MSISRVKHQVFLSHGVFEGQVGKGKGAIDSPYIPMCFRGILLKRKVINQPSRSNSTGCAKVSVGI